MAKFKPGTYVKVIDMDSRYFGQIGKIINDYRSGNEPQAYGIQFDDGEYWIREVYLELANETLIYLWNKKRG